MTTSETKTIERCRVEDLGYALTIKPEFSGNPEAQVELARELTALNSYLSQFARPEPAVEGETYFLFGRVKCPGCGKSLNGMMGTFRWGITHGEGNCICGWPARGIHCPTYEDGTEIFDGCDNSVLAYHPSVVEQKERGDEGE